MRLGLIGYTNKASGIGLFTWEFWKYLGADSILSVEAGIKGQEVWTDRQLTAGRPPTKKEIAEYLNRYNPDVVMFLETPFSEQVYESARKRNVRTVGIPMHETFLAVLMVSDLLICPCFSAWEKARTRKKKLLFLPIGMELFPFRLRTGHTLVLNIGYGGPHDRRQGAKVVEAFQAIQNPSARLIVNSQVPVPLGVKKRDARITYNIGSKAAPKDVYAEGDIAINVMAYGGYERPILEAMASGMPTFTTDADPMNLFQHDHDFLIEPCRRTLIRKSDWVVNTVYNEVSVNDLREKMEWLLTIDTKKYSLRARAQAEAQSWECKDIDYRAVWLEAIESA